MTFRRILSNNYIHNCVRVAHASIG